MQLVLSCHLILPKQDGLMACQQSRQTFPQTVIIIVGTLPTTLAKSNITLLMSLRASWHRAQPHLRFHPFSSQDSRALPMCKDGRLAKFCIRSWKWMDSALFRRTLTVHNSINTHLAAERDIVENSGKQISC